MDKKKIAELIVVEGKNDTANLRKYYDCDTIETHGTHLGKEILSLIERAAKVRGVIVFTDPDSPGNRIRKAVNDAIPGCKNAYVEKKDARTSKKVGVEHAGYEALEEALNHLTTRRPEIHRISMQDMYALGLSGRPDSGEKRKKVGSLLHLGFGNAKTMCSRFNDLGITVEQIQEVLDK